MTCCAMFFKKMSECSSDS